MGVESHWHNLGVIHGKEEFGYIITNGPTRLSDQVLSSLCTGKYGSVLESYFKGYVEGLKLAAINEVKEGLAVWPADQSM